MRIKFFNKLSSYASRIAVLVFLITCNSSFTQQTANQFRRLDISHGLSSNQVNTMFSDSQGFIWIATISGLNRYDGSSFRLFKNDPDSPGSLADNSIHYIYEDHLGLLWLFNASGDFFIYDPLTESFSTDHEIFNKNTIIPRENISFVEVDPFGNLWIGNNEHGIFHYHTIQDQITHLTSGNSRSVSSDNIIGIAFCNEGMAYAIDQAGIINVIDIHTLKITNKITYEKGDFYSETNREYRLFIDRDQDIWLYSVNSGDGIYFIDRTTGETNNINHRSSPVRLSNPNVTGLIMDHQDQIWVGTEHGGINVLEKSGHNIKILQVVPGDITSLSSNSITSLHQCKDEIIWVGTFKNGVNFYHEFFFPFTLYRSQPFQEEQYFSNDVNCFAEDRHGNLWIGTNDDGLVYYNRNTGTFTRYRHDPNDAYSISSNVIVSLFVDHDDGLWIGTYLGGLNHFDGRRFRHYRHNPLNPASLAEDRVWQVHKDTGGRLWVGTLGGGLGLYDEKTGGFIHHRSNDFNSVSSDFILSSFEDSSGKFWIGTTSGLDVFDPATGRFRNFQHEPGLSGSLSNNSVLSIIEDSQGNIWVGTRNGLNLLDQHTETFRVFREPDGLPDHNIVSLEMDKKGNLWIATLNGLSNMIFGQSGQGLVFRNFDERDGLQGREFNERSSIRTSRGELIFGGANGFNIFLPEDIVTFSKDHQVLFTDFRLFNNRVGIGEAVDGKVLLPVSVSQMEQITLKHNQNVFSIEFSALNFFNPERTRFRYMLEGFNSNWFETDAANNQATYTNLNPGRYLFRVSALGNNGEWGEESVIAIVVVPPFYSTTWAYMIYILIIIASVIYLVMHIKYRENLKYVRRQEKEEFDRIRQLDAMKTRFFTNVSHEFRTPLTMILTPIEKLKTELEDERLQKQVSVIHKNGIRLLNLVNQLLDFRKLEVSRIHLNPSYADIVQLLIESFTAFSDLFEAKNIRHEFNTNVKEYYAHFDADKIEKITFNLLSNAVKFTPVNGSVKMDVCNYKPGDEGFSENFGEKEYLEIKVKDTGIGISAERQKRIFDRFYQGDDDDALVNQGSGIGLSLVLEFVKMHQGVVSVESNPGKGSCFAVQLPLETSAPVEAAAPENDLSTEPEQEEKCTSNRKAYLKPGDKPVVLVVEDNEDLRYYLKENLMQDYEIIEAPDGKTGWEMAIEKVPHLVVTDIMMPVESGLDLCRKIKADPRTSHIPVILLTARTSDEQKIEGLEAGAEDYITKPFTYELLQLKIRRLIDLRIAFQKTFTRKFEIKPGEIGITSLDEKFLAKALKVAEDNISNPDFSVEKMGKELGVSRGHLYNKLLALTGKSPVEFIRIMRLKRAAQLLGKSQMTVAEIAFQVGFNDPKYFTKHFKEEFGMVPSEYARKNM